MTKGQLSVRLAAGKYLLQVGSAEGVLVFAPSPDERFEPQPRRLQLPDLPPRPAFWLDREGEVERVAAVLQEHQPGRVELTGRHGVGKTALLSYLASHPLTAAFPSGVVYLSARLQTLPDLFQSLFEAFYQSQSLSRPDDGQVHRSLDPLQALILLDDVDLNAQEIYELTAAAPGSTFLLASSERRFWREGQSVELSGLPEEDAITLFERTLGRPMEEEERATASALVAALQGYPLLIVQTASLVRYTGRSVTEISNLQSRRSPDQEAMIRLNYIPANAISNSLQNQLLETLSEAERLAAFSLAVLGGASAAPNHLAALTGLPEIVPTLEAMEARGLVQSYAGRYSLAGGLDERALNTWDLTEWKTHALVYFTRWAGTQALGSEALRDEIYVLLELLKWAAGMGRWQEALLLVRSMEGTLALSGRWEAWRQTLQIGLEAARAFESPAAEAWALHQMGTRLLCLGQTSPARASLIHALRLRQSLGDREGELATRHNLGLLLHQEPSETGDSVPHRGGMQVYPAPASLLPVPVPGAWKASGGAPVRGGLRFMKLPIRLSRPLAAGILLSVFILLIPAAYLGWRYFHRTEPGGPTATPYVLIVETPIILPTDEPGATLYFPLLFNQYSVNEEQGAMAAIQARLRQPDPP